MSKKNKRKGPAVARNSSNSNRGLSRQEQLAQLLSAEDRAILAENALRKDIIEEAKEKSADRNATPHNRKNYPTGRETKQWVSSGHRTFVNPYNFIPFGEKEPYRTAPQNGTLTGCVTCILETKTPLIIPDSNNATSDPNMHEHKILPFFQCPTEKDGTLRPVIPGSTLRGALRTLYESATNSCVPIDAGDDVILSTRLETMGAAKERGLLEYNAIQQTWSLYAANDYRIEAPRLVDGKVQINDDASTHYASGCEITFVTYEGQRYNKRQRKNVPCLFAKAATQNEKTDSDTSKQASAPQTGYLQCVPPLGGNGAVNPRVLVKVPTALKTWGKGDHTPANELDTVLKLYLENADASTGRNTLATPYADMNARLQEIRNKGGCIPVWYLTLGAQNAPVYYLTCSSIGRIVMHNTWDDLLGSHKSCRDVAALCPACALFGNAYKDASYTGHLRFEDAQMTSDFTETSFSTITLPELAAPKPTATVFYTKRPIQSARSWNYDYYNENNQITGEFIAQLQNLLLGRKSYWHHTPVKEVQTCAAHATAPSANTPQAHSATIPPAHTAAPTTTNAPTSVPKTKRNCTATALQSGVTFQFKIYFEEISQRQLDELIWICTLGENTAESTRQQKIGFAKPLGYGSVKITVSNVLTRTLQYQDGNLCYQMNPRKVQNINGMLCYEAGEQTPQQPIDPPNTEGSPLMQAFLAMCSTTSTQGKTVAYPLGSSMTVGENQHASHQWFAGNKTFKQNCYVMPCPTDEDITLPQIEQIPAYT